MRLRVQLDGWGRLLLWLRLLLRLRLLPWLLLLHLGDLRRAHLLLSGRPGRLGSAPPQLRLQLLDSLLQL